ncbi:MAG: hypothetical protein ACJZ8G_03010 [Candidatus Pelagibacter sp.]|tara:strand:+ start:55 stop:1227 length:1173 start_codon:yes stop_codon:yes gene_type:complete
MKKKSKKSKKKNSSKRNIKKRKIVKIKNKIQRNFKKKKKKKNINSKKNLFHQSSKKNNKILLKIINLQDKFKPNIKIKFNPFVSLDKFLLKFFQNISDTIGEYKSLKIEQKRILKIKEMERIENEKKEKLEQISEEKDLQNKLKQQMLKDEIKLEKERTKDIKLFLRKEQAIIRQEQAEKQRKFLEQLKIEKQIEKFRIREIKELEQLEKLSLKEQREDYSSLQERIDKLKQKYQIIRDQKIRERVEALGIKTLGDEDRETLLQKEKDYTLARQKIEFALESFYRSSSSLVFQLNKRHITRHMSILRCIDRRFETGEIFIKWDESEDDKWLLLIYIKNNSPDEGIIIEDKTNQEKNISHEFKSSEIFKASDLMVDSLTQLISKIRKKKQA